MEYVQGESLSPLVKNTTKAGERMPWGHIVSVMAGMLHGLHAAHEAKSERREPLNIVHRDVSPQNVLVGTDGVARVLDFGVAKAAMRVGSTRDNQMKGKLRYMSPEQLNGKAVDRRTDIFAAAVVLWETIVGKRLFDGSDAGEIFAKVLATDIPEPKSLVPSVPSSLNAVVMKGLERNPDRRYQTAREFAIALESSAPPSTTRAVGEWVEQSAHSELQRRGQMIVEIESVAMSPEELAKFERESSAPPSGGHAIEHSSISGVKQASGSRPRVDRPSRSRIADDVATSIEDGSAPKSVSTSAVSTLAVPKVLSPAPRKGSGSGIYIGALAACVAGGALALLVFSRVGAKPEGSAAGTSDPAVLSASQTPASAATRPVSPTETVNVDDFPVAPPPDAGEQGSATPGRTRRILRGAAKGKEPAAPNCNPPFFMDANGIRRLKPGCL